MKYSLPRDNYFLEVPVREYSDADIRSFAAGRSQELSEEGHERLTRATLVHIGEHLIGERYPHEGE